MAVIFGKRVVRVIFTIMDYQTLHKVFDADQPDANLSRYQTIWERIRDKLKSHYGDATFKSWMKSLHLYDVSNGQVTLKVPTRFIREWVINHYVDTIKAFWQAELEGVHTVNVLVGLPQVPPADSNMDEAQGTKSESTVMPSQIVDFSSQDSDDISSPLDRRFVFDNFVVGKSNALGHAAARAVAEAKSVVPGSNPLFLYGGVGLGKTHLMHAIAWDIRKNSPERKVIYLSAEKFMYRFIQALRNKDIMSFKKQFRSVDVLMIDDIQFICGKDSTQEEFFHTFNTLIDQKSQLVITADRSPTDLDGMEERVRSRLGWGLVADINTTTYELRLGILESKLEQMRVNVPSQVVEFLASKITSNVRELEGALNKVVAHSTLVGREITLENTQDLLHDLLRANDRVITIEDIQKKVAERYNIRVSDLSSNRRTKNIALPRQISMFLCKQLTSRSLAEIGRKFGGKDHTTVMHAVRKIEKLIVTDKELSEDVELLGRLLQQ